MPRGSNAHAELGPDLDPDLDLDLDLELEISNSRSSELSRPASLGSGSSPGLVRGSSGSSPGLFRGSSGSPGPLSEAELRRLELGQAS